MNLNRRQMLHRIASGSSVGINMLAGCRSNDVQGFLVIFHGMFLFQFASDPKTGERQMIAHMPMVPPMGVDQGHIYKANSQNSASNLVELKRSPPAVFKLTGPTSVSTKPSGIDDTKNIVFQTNNGCPFNLTGTGGACKIVMPIPEEYRGWRSVYSINPGKPLFSTQDPCIKVPRSVFSTHIFRYKSPGRPALIDGSQTAIWPPSGSLGTRLHLFAQPMNFGELVKATKGIKLTDHTAYLDAMFEKPPQITTADPRYLCETEEHNPGWGLRTAELLDLNESGSHSSTCPGEASSRNEGVQMTNESIFHLINGQLLNCRSYFLIQS
jgi:hypothetical protein